MFYDRRKTDEDDDRGLYIKDRIVSWDIDAYTNIMIVNKPSEYRVLIEELDFGRGAGNFFDAVEIQPLEFGNVVVGLVNIYGNADGEGIYEIDVKPFEATIHFSIIYDEDRRDPQNDGKDIDLKIYETFDIRDFDNEPELNEGHYHLNVQGLNVEIDMKGTTDSSKWEFTGTILWIDDYFG